MHHEFSISSNTPVSLTRPAVISSNPCYSTCCQVIVIVGLFALGIVNIKAGREDNQVYLVAIGGTFLGVSLSLVTFLGTMAIKSCVENRKKAHRLRESNDYVELDG